jgi:hypothetical protein
MIPPLPRRDAIQHNEYSSPAPAMYATATSTAGPTTGTTKAASLVVPTCYISSPTGCDSGAGSASATWKEWRTSTILLFCLRGIAAFCWAASRRTLERMLLAYLQSSVDPTILRSLIAGLITAGPRGASAPVPTGEAWTVRGKEGGAVAVAHRAVGAGAGGGCATPRKVSWSYLRGACTVSV